MKNYWQAFGSLFFLLHQGKLLWFLNAPVVGRWFRWVLRIHGKSSSVGHRRIFRILPNAIFWWDGPNQKAEFRTHAKFSKRLYYAFAPLWWMLHAWDWAFADRWIPELSFGFATLTSYPDAHPETDTVDGNCYHNGAALTWAQIRGGAGTGANDSAVNGNFFKILADTTSNTWAYLYRYLCLFNTSALTTSATISDATLSLCIWAKSNTLGGTNPDINIYSSNPASNTALAAGDFDSLGTTPFATAIAYADVDIVAAYNDFPQNAAGLAAIVKDGITKLGVRNANYDVANSAPTWASSGYINIAGDFADQTGNANDPKLVVTYTTGQVIMISQKPMGLKGIALMAVIGAVAKNPSISRKKLLRWWHEDN